MSRVVLVGVGTAGDDNTTGSPVLYVTRSDGPTRGDKKIAQTYSLEAQVQLDLDLHLTTVMICIMADPVAFIPHKISANIVVTEFTPT